MKEITPPDSATPISDAICAIKPSPGATQIRGYTYQLEDGTKASLFFAVGDEAFQIGQLMSSYVDELVAATSKVASREEETSKPVARKRAARKVAAQQPSP